MAASPSLDPFRSTASWPLLRRLIRDFVLPQAGRVVLALLAMLVLAGATVAVAHMLKPAIDGIVAGSDPDALWGIGGGILAAFTIKALANYVQVVLMAEVGQQAIAAARKRLYRHLAGMDLAFFQSHSASTLATRFTVDLTQMRLAMSEGMTSLGRDLVTLVALVGHTVWLDWRMALLAYVVLPTAIWPVTRLGRRIRKAAGATQRELGGLNARLTQTLRAIRMVKLHNAEDRERARVHGLIERVRRLSFRAEWTRALVSPIMELVSGIAIGGALYYGGQRVLEGAVTAGDLTAFLGSLLLAYQPAKRIANLHAILQEGLSAADRLYHLLDMAPALSAPADGPVLALTDGRVTFEAVSFSYGSAPDTMADGNTDPATAPAPLPSPPAPPRATALHGVSLTLEPGTVTALVGPSGAGKSTLLNLIPRFHDPESGRILVDGQDIRRVALPSLWDAIALVSQEITIFDDTVSANIAYGRPDIAPDAICSAARQAGADRFIEALPQGYDTRLGEMGVRLSGGQRQRIAIARAFLKNAPILLLDEPTAALDTESERLVQETLADLMVGRTCLVVAHRLSTIAGAHTIHVMEGGRLSESGTHDSLLAAGGAYARLLAAHRAGA